MQEAIDGETFIETMMWRRRGFCGTDIDESWGSYLLGTARVKRCAVVSANLANGINLMTIVVGLFEVLT